MSWSRHISRSITTPNRSSRSGRPVVEFIIHHNASMGGSYVLGLMRTGLKQVSANYQIMQDGEAVGVVPREERSWSASNADWDGSAITFEIANNSGGPGWTISNEAYHTVARIIADDAAHFGIPINRTTVRGHREGSALGHGGSYATACPGGINLDLLTELAQQYSAGTAGGGNTPIEEDDMFTDEDRARQMRIENELNNTKAGIWTGGSGLIDGKAKKFNYGVLPIVVRTQEQIAELSTRLAALEKKLGES